jgi:serine/threonine-protein kinase RsbW
VNALDITIVNRVSEFARVADGLDRLGVDQHFAPDLLADMQVAMDEVLTNITSYAYADDAPHEIHVHLEVRDDRLEAVIEDDGVPFDPLTARTPDVSAPLHERRLGGVGIHFVTNLMDDVAYRRIGDRNRLVLTKRLKT